MHISYILRTSFHWWCTVDPEKNIQTKTDLILVTFIFYRKAVVKQGSLHGTFVKLDKFRFQNPPL
jgi:hypothetical protein